MNLPAMVGYDLGEIVNNSEQLALIHKNELQPGDQVLLKTLNSVYRIKVLDHGYYTVSGGWFDKEKLSPLKTTISGCTWGGCIIKTDVVAACGLCVEFGNKVMTSRIKKIFYIPGSYEN
jgi:hypothetical protein